MASQEELRHGVGRIDQLFGSEQSFQNLILVHALELQYAGHDNAGQRR